MLNFNLLINKLMNKKASEVGEGKKVESEESKLIQAIIDVQKEIEDVKSFFNNQDEEGLLEYAIYTENAAKARYSHYINKLKEIENRNRNKVG